MTKKRTEKGQKKGQIYFFSSFPLGLPCFLLKIRIPSFFSISSRNHSLPVNCPLCTASLISFISCSGTVPSTYSAYAFCRTCALPPWINMIDAGQRPDFFYRELWKHSLTSDIEQDQLPYPHGEDGVQCTGSRPANTLR